jgi:hypothetical protein
MHTSFSGTIYVPRSYILLLLLLFTPKTASCLGDSGDLCSRCGCHRGARIFFGRVGSPRTSGLTDMHTAMPPPSKKKKKKRKIEETIVSAPFVRTKGDPKILIVVHYLAFPVFVYAHTTSCVRIYTSIYIYTYILCVYYTVHICGGFSFSGEKVVCKVKCTRRIYNIYILYVIYI